MEDTMCKQLDNIQSLIDNLNVEDLLNDFSITATKFVDFRKYIIRC